MADVAVRIQGAGPVGLMLALCLRQAGWSANAIELVDPAIDAPTPPHDADPRILALSHGTLLRLAQLNVPHDATPIRQIHVSAQGHFGAMEINTDRVGVDHLGGLINYGSLLTELRKKAVQAGLLIHATAASDRTHDVLVIAEGGLFQPEKSALPQNNLQTNSQSNSGARLVRDYEQEAVIGWVETTPAADQRAWERFTSQGVVALLPVKGRYALVWCSSTSTAQDFAQADMPKQVEMVSAVMSDRVGQIHGVTITGRYPLGLKWRDQIVEGHTVWIGNSAQTLHPIGGQGMNLGFRDAETLATCLLQRGLSLDARLADYAARRGPDRWAVRTATDTLARQPWVRRAIGGIALMPGAKKLLGQVLMYGG